MIAQQARSVVAGAAALLVLTGLWFAMEVRAPERVLVPVGDGADAAVEGLDVLDPPADLDAAHAAAEAFAIALYGDDHDGLREVATEAFADRLLGGARGRSSGEVDVRVDGVTTQDAQPGRVLAKVAVRRGALGGERLEVVTVVVVRADGRWLVDDAAF